MIVIRAEQKEAKEAKLLFKEIKSRTRKKNIEILIMALKRLNNSYKSKE